MNRTCLRIGRVSRLHAARASAAVCAAMAGLALQTSAGAWAQGSPQTITVTGRTSSTQAAGVAGFGDVPLAQSPFSGSVLSTRQLLDAGIDSIAHLTRLDAGTTDSYNAPGYWGTLAVRGFTVDNRSNVRRDGLPINAETVLTAANKQAFELLKGTSGLQAGVSAPGGLLNLVVKRPAGDINSTTLNASERGTIGLHADLGRGATQNAALAWRLNAEAEHLRPQTRSLNGRRSSLAGAAELATGSAGLLELEAEWSNQSQPSMPGFSLLGPKLPDARSIDPRTNLNNQAWTQPVVFIGSTASVRYTHTLGAQWKLVAHAMQQRLRTDDRVAFPFGCSSDGDYTRYCTDGSFDLYDYRSEGERRTQQAASLSVHGRSLWGGVEHHLHGGVLASRFKARFNAQAYNWVGTGTVDASTQLPADPTLAYDNTNRSERSTEWHVQDRVVLGPGSALWLGLRHTRLQRASEQTSGTEPIAYNQAFTTPFAALSHEPRPGLMAYISTGQGVETAVTPNLPIYLHAGQPLAALKSRQVEVGLKQRAGAATWALAAFDIQRPQWSDQGTCDVVASCNRQPDGSARHRGLEAEAEWSTGALSLRGSALWLHARREGAASAAAKGLQPTNVPQQAIKLQAAYNLRQVPGLALLAFASHEGRRMVLPDNSVATPGWARLDLGLRYNHISSKGQRTTWRLGLDNAGNRRAWKEAPFQYGHTYLYPLQPRQWHGSVQLSL